MSISVGGVNLTEGLIDAQYRIATLERIVEHLIKRSPAETISQGDIEKYRDEALREMQQKYPTAGIQKR